MALNSLFCADVPLSNYSLTHSICPPLFDGGPGYYPRENFAIKMLVGVIFKHFRNKLNFAPTTSLFPQGFPWRILHRWGCLWEPWLWLKHETKLERNGTKGEISDEVSSTVYFGERQTQNTSDIIAVSTISNIVNPLNRRPGIVLKKPSSAKHKKVTIERNLGSGAIFVCTLFLEMAQQCLHW